MNLNKNESFTLIELLIVVAIVGILASIIVVNLVQDSVVARDVKRKSDLALIHGYLDNYYNTNGQYPQAGTCAYNTTILNCAVFSSAGSAWIPALTPIYISSLPVDPLNRGGSPWNAGGHEYAYGGVFSLNGQAAQTYNLVAQLENTSDGDICGIKNWKYMVSSGTVTPWCSAFGGSYSNQLYENSPRSTS